MKPILLELSAFGPYREVEVIDFTELGNRHLFLITGPTGSGKTTIFDGISFALYGETSGSFRNVEGLRSHFSDEDVLTEVKLTFELKGIRYHIHRIPKQLRPKARTGGYTEQKSDATLIIEDKDPKTVITGVTSVNAKIEEIMGINSEQFKQIMMIPQGEFRILLNADSQEREKVLQKLFDTEVYRRVQLELGEMAKSLWNDVRNKKVERDTLVTKFKHGEDEDLKGLIFQEDKNLDQIILGIKKLGKNDEDAIINLNNEIQTVEKQREIQIQDREKGMELNRQLLEKELVTDSLNKLKLEEDRINEGKEKVIAAQKALPIIPLEENIGLRKKEQEESLKESLELTALLDEYRVNVIESQKKLDQATSIENKAIDEALNKQIHLYESYADKVKEIESHQNQLNINGKDLENLNKQKKQLEDKANQFKINLALAKEEIEQHKDIHSLLLDETNRKEKQEELVKQVEKAIEFAKDLEKAHSKKAKLDQELASIRLVLDKQQIEYKREKIKFFMNQASILAKDLKENQPCPVCGSEEHPNLARGQIDVLSEEDLNSLEEKALTIESQVKEMAKDQAVLLERISLISRELDGLLTLFELEGSKSEGALNALYEKVEKNKEELTLGKKRLLELDGFRVKYEKALVNQKELEKLREGNEALMEQIQKQLQEVALSSMQLSTILEQIYKDVPKELRSQKALQDSINNLVKEKNLRIKVVEEARAYYLEAQQKEEKNKTKLEELAKALAKEKERIEKLESQWIDKIKVSGFETIELYECAKLSTDQINVILAEIESYNKELSRLTTLADDLEKKTKDKSQVDIKVYDEKINEMMEMLLSYQKDRGLIDNRIKDNQQTLHQIVVIQQQIGDKENRYKTIGHLANVAQGRNKNMITFERFVLAAFLEDILKAANIRFGQMTQGRYVMHRSDELERKNKQSGLEIEVFDHWTGKARHVKTLSGGESFKASLSMALGLSDVVQSYAGGVRLDTMFIDEGFGTLDQESLDSAINCLVDLQKSGRLVGIISHVQELKERIDTRLEVVTTNDGSQSRFVLS